MAVTLDATVGGTAANSYLTLAAAEDLAEYQIALGGWGTAADADKTKALIAATGNMDNGLVFVVVMALIGCIILLPLLKKY